LLIECSAIIIIILGVFFIFLRQKKGDYAICIVPLLLLPFAHIAGEAIVPLLGKVTAANPEDLRIAIDATALMGACLLFGSLGQLRIKSKKARRFYFGLCSGFTVILSWILIFNTTS